MNGQEMWLDIQALRHRVLELERRLESHVTPTDCANLVATLRDRVNVLDERLSDLEQV